MRIETSKSHQADKNAEKNEKSNFKSEKSIFDSSTQIKKATTVNIPTVGAFEKILIEARKESGAEKDKFFNGKGDASESAKSAEKDEDLELSRRLEQKAELKEKNRREGKGGDSSGEDESSAAFSAPGFSAEKKSSADAETVPAARSILHVADLERIISFVRTQTLKDSKEITIALKHSVLEGLQIKISLNQSGKLKAEFFAANEQTKTQLKKRKDELLEILNNRSSKFAEIDILSL